MKIISKRKYVIGIDTNEDVNSYTLLMQDDGNTIYMLLGKTIKKKKKFWKEVNNLAKYFNAEIIKEV